MSRVTPTTIDLYRRRSFVDSSSSAGWQTFSERHPLIDKRSPETSSAAYRPRALLSTVPRFLYFSSKTRPTQPSIPPGSVNE